MDDISSAVRLGPDIPYNEQIAPNGWTVCSVVDANYCYNLGYYKEDGGYYCCCNVNSGGQLPYCPNKRKK